MTKSCLFLPYGPKNINQCSALTLLIILSGDKECNPGPRIASVFPCGYCESPVTWTDQGVCCDGCGLWHHKSCGDISTKEMEYLEHSSVVWHCCKCESTNIDSFTFNSYELHTTNLFSPLSDISVDSLNSTTPFSPLHTSSPHPKKDNSYSTSVSPEISKTHSRNENSSGEHSSFLPKKTNLRLLTVNCCSIREHRSEFTAALDYVKPDLICGTESWLKGVKPEKEPAKNAIKTSEIFPSDFCGSFMFLFCLVFAMFCARLFICALWSPAGKGLTSWLSFVVSSVSLSLSHWYPGSGVVLDCIDS